MSDGAVLFAVTPDTIGYVSGTALFVLAMGVLSWPFLRRIATARKQRAAELRVALGRGEKP